MTTNKTVDLRQNLNSARPDQIADVLAAIKFGNMASVIKVVVAGLTSSATVDITAAATKAAATITGIDLDTGENLPAIGHVITLRTGAGGTLAAGPAIVTDVGGTPTAIGALAAHVATLSDDGTTLVFQAAVVAFTLVYVPRSYIAMTTTYPLGAPGGA